MNVKAIDYAPVVKNIGKHHAQKTVFVDALNICIGKNCGEHLTTGHHNIILYGGGNDLQQESYLFICGNIRYKMTHEEWLVMFDYVQKHILKTYGN